MRKLLCLVGSLLGASVLASPVSFDSHHISLKLDVPTHSAVMSDRGLMVVTKGWNWFYLNDSAKVQKFAIDGRKCTFRTARAKDTTQLPVKVREELRSGAELPDAMLVMFESGKGKAAKFEIEYSAVFNEDVSNIRFSRESVGREVSGTILDQGAYLSPSSYFYPEGSEQLSDYSVTADIPAMWSSICDGNLLATTTAGDRKVESWHNPYKNDGCILMAAPYVSSSTTSDSTEIVCLFFDADTSLAPNYLKASAGYVKMYSDLIGPYPFKRFTVAENFFPTGYGMPGWTLLGQTVIRLPFIISTSLGHEVLHNWWGNSVYVDYNRGNWCEGLTVYGADYQYKLKESPAAAREYRKDILKQYVSYVSKDKDFPLRDFKSRTSPNTRAIGYNKAMMVFHMIEQEIGTPAFFDAWKLVYRDYLGKQVGWEEWVKAFESTSGKDLSFVIPEWIDRTGAPVLGIQIAKVSDGSTPDTKQVTLRLTQTSGQPYHLRVPISIAGGSERTDTTILMPDSVTTLALAVTSGATISVDPEYDLFRRLYPEEVEPIISAVLGAPKSVFVLGQSDEPLAAAFREFAGGVSEDSAIIFPEASSASVPSDAAKIILNPSAVPDYIAKQAKITPDSVTISGVGYLRAGHSFVLSGQSADGTGKYWVLISNDAASLPRLGQLVPHYGKYSYLVFEGAKNVAKGQWEVTDSPLRVVVR